jgi:hypothetical protein
VVFFTTVKRAGTRFLGPAMYKVADEQLKGRTGEQWRKTNAILMGALEADRDF